MTWPMFYLGGHRAVSLCLLFFYLWLQSGLPRVGFAGDCGGKFPNPATVEVTLALPCPCHLLL